MEYIMIFSCCSCAKIVKRIKVKELTLGNQIKINGKSIKLKACSCGCKFIRKELIEK